MTPLQDQQARLNEIVYGFDHGRKIAVVLEGRDSAGKSGTIRELTHFLPTPEYRVMTTNKPTEGQMKNWLAWWRERMPQDDSPLISFYDRSWYSRALVQRVNEWCNEKQYRYFMNGVLAFEESQPDTLIIKFWLSISNDEQKARLKDRKTSKLRGWKYSNNDAKALSRYDRMTLAKEALFTSTGQHWNVIDYNNKKEGRLNLITRLNDILENEMPIDY